MPQIIVTADCGAAFGDGAVTHRERVNVADFESQHFAAQLVERLGWAVADADEAEQFDDEEFSDRIPDEPTSSDESAAGDEPAARDEPATGDEPAATDERVTAPSPA